MQVRRSSHPGHTADHMNYSKRIVVAGSLKGEVLAAVDAPAPREADMSIADCKPCLKECHKGFSRE